jgi:hypothetical protein
VADSAQPGDGKATPLVSSALYANLDWLSAPTWLGNGGGAIYNNSLTNLLFQVAIQPGVVPPGPPPGGTFVLPTHPAPRRSLVAFKLSGE